MANPFKIEIPSFTPGEPGFAAKLNQLAGALRETQEIIVEISEEEVIEEAEPAAEAAEEKPKAAPRGRKAAEK